MGRALRTDVGDLVYHCLNRANARALIFKNKDDYELFENILEQAVEKYDMRLLSYCLMPNHFHLVLYPRKDGDLSKFMNWLTLTHTQRRHVLMGTTGEGHLYQGRYKSFICQDDTHFISLVRYVERNAKKSRLVKKAENWRWSSAWRREYGTAKQKSLLSKWPVQMPKDYLDLLNEEQGEDEEIAIEGAEHRGNPFGDSIWTEKIVSNYGLQATIRKRGRPKILVLGNKGS